LLWSTEVLEERDDPVLVVELQRAIGHFVGAELCSCLERQLRLFLPGNVAE